MIKRHASLVLVPLLIITLGLFAGCQETTVEKVKEDTKSIPKETYENPDLLVETRWLDDHLGEDSLKAIDVRTSTDYAKGHVRGALNLPIGKTDDADSSIKGMVIPKDQFEDLMGSLGIKNDDKVVIYDAKITPFVGRLFWIMEYYGHKKVSVLNGGFQEWKLEGREVVQDDPDIKETTYKAKLDPNKNALRDEVEDRLDKEDVVFVDTRPPDEFNGGHLPGAIQMDWTELLTDGDIPVIRPAGELRKIFEDDGVTKEKDLVLY